jgi:hypothetical protein
VEKPRTRGGYLSELTVIIKGIIRNITRKEMRFAKFPFYCPGCGDLSTPLKRGEGPQADTVFFCNRCKNSPAASKPAGSTAPSIKPAAYATPSIKAADHNVSNAPIVGGMNTKKAIAEAAREMRRIADQAGRDLSALRDSPFYSHDVGAAIEREREALSILEGGRQKLARICMDCCSAMKGAVPETRLESYIAPNGYVMRRMVQAPQVVEIESFYNACYLLAIKYTQEAGWFHTRCFEPGAVQKRLLKLNCSSCAKPSYAWTTGELQYDQTLCASCLSLHLAKSH